MVTMVSPEQTTPGFRAGALQRRVRRVLAPVARRLWRIDTTGYDRIPAEGPAILCPNHISFLDSVLLMLTMPRNVHFVGKAEYMQSWKTKFLFPAVGMIPIDRAGGDTTQRQLAAVAEVLAHGDPVAIFPEGTRSRDGALHKGRTGAARLAFDVGCPIFPIGIVGTDAIQPPGARVPKPFKRCSLTIGHAIRPEKYRPRREPPVVWRTMIDEVMFEIREMTGQTYLDQYAGHRSETSTKLPAVTEPSSATDDAALSPPPDHKHDRAGYATVTVPT
jgi:1-acyl-sn-glycerol-3-phosphate acyltransferase